jgi:all-trans-retinol 13,14-reductase
MSKLTQPYKRHPITEDYDAIVIGSGIGGLSCAAMLAKHGGKRVLVLERHYTPGGYTHVFRRPGYEWDVGVHYIGDVAEGSVLRAIFDEVSEEPIEWADMGDVYDRIIIGDDTYDFPKGRRNLQAALNEWFPGEEEAIDGYFAAVKETSRASMTFHASKVADAIVDIEPETLQLMRSGFDKWAQRTTLDVLEDLTNNRRLIAVLTGQFGDYGLPPSQSSFGMHAVLANHYFEGGYYPIGGSGIFAERMIPVITKAGGVVVTSAEVAQIVVENGRAVGVRMAVDDAVIRAPMVISDAGLLNTAERLLPEGDGEQLEEAVESVGASIAHLCLYVGFRESAADLDLPKHNLWIYPHDDYDRLFEEALSDPEAPLPVVYVSFPAAKDPDFDRRHPGRATVDIISAAPYEWFAQWEGSAWKKRDAEYEALKERLAQRMLDTLFEQLPQLRGKVDVYELSSPLTTQHFSGYAYGELYGLNHSPDRFAEVALQPRTNIDGLFLTGQDIVTAGVSSALMGGVLTASAILRANLLLPIINAVKAQSPG